MVGEQFDDSLEKFFAVFPVHGDGQLSLGLCSIGTLTNGSFLQAADAMELTERKNVESKSTSQTEKSDSAMLLVLIAAVVIGCCAPTFYLATRLRNRSSTRKESPKPLPKQEESNATPAPSWSDEAFSKRQRIRRVFENNMSSLLHGSLKARHIMSRQVTCVGVNEKVERIREIFSEKMTRYILVQNRDGTLVGVIGRNDLLQRDGRTAADVMSADIQTIAIDSDISAGITQLICRRIGCLPVLDEENNLIGVITATDFLLAFQCAIRTLAGVLDQIQERPEELTKLATSQVAALPVSTT